MDQGGGRHHPRQTLSFLRNLFEERGLSPRSKLGQNFLIDLNLIDLIARAAELTDADVALEVGSGTGSLTVKLLERAAAVLSVEIDEGFHELVKEALGRSPALTLLHADVLESKNRLNPVVLDALTGLLESTQARRVKLVANLPYVVATPVISNLLLTELPIERMVVTVQWEIAEKLIAGPGTREYGALAVLVQSLADVSLVRKLGPSVFWPRPKVDSAIVKIVPSAEKRRLIGDAQRFRNFLRDLYSHRRKNLRGGLASFPGKRWAKQEIDARLTDLGVDPSARAETLDLETHLRLAAVFGE
jgi:16S rRNA (adenine1518-N6/adenine1519-N6)-dimethyltransferase